MEKENVIITKSYAFALKVVLLFKELQKNREFILSKQLVRSATSIGANVEEGVQGQSKADFIHKFSIAQKEAFESNYWLRLLRDSGYLSQEQSLYLLKDGTEIQRIITSLLKTAKSKH